MHVDELLRRADGLIAPTLSGELVRQAEMREVGDSAREFLLQLPSWYGGHPDDMWTLRTVFNAHNTPPLWVPITFSLTRGSPNDA